MKMLPRRLLALAALLGVCACAGQKPVLNPYVKGRPAEYRLPASAAPEESRDAFAARVRRLQAAAAGRERTFSVTIETVDAELREALALSAVAPTAENEVRVAGEYVRLGITDQAADHLATAIQLDPRCAPAHDLLARLWRDWGFPAHGLGDAYRAVHAAPASAAAQNTLGTLLHRLGRFPEAAARYSKAAQLDPSAAYPLNNLCALALERGDVTAALNFCREALALEPGMDPAARNFETARRLAERGPRKGGQ